MADERFLIVGLGNPGPRYAATRHNIGFAVLDLLALRVGAKFKAHRSRCEVAETRLAGQSVVLAKPLSFMNESGGPVVGAARFFKVPVENIVVAHDELDLPFGSLRLKRGGGEGGHNGLRSMSNSLGSKEYARVRFGVGRPPGRQDPADYVLREFAGSERKELGFLIDRAADAVEALISQGLEAAQNEFND
ncbi:aminoacyl-tRNA hydrolase [Jatrophihabitans sp.]|uniref:aminoacyl-tRNA hydrolase n=1 Tax=Jatrophihabitans sp. TaxID=1932789 RepID=UPI0030C6D844|nr:aminoacyl-tRNA hydrolase [Jatrophihabitans sp.]